MRATPHDLEGSIAGWLDRCWWLEQVRLPQRCAIQLHVQLNASRLAFWI